MGTIARITSPAIRQMRAASAPWWETQTNLPARWSSCAAYEPHHMLSSSPSTRHTFRDTADEQRCSRIFQQSRQIFFSLAASFFCCKWVLVWRPPSVGFNNWALFQFQRIHRVIAGQALSRAFDAATVWSFGDGALRACRENQSRDNSSHRISFARDVAWPCEHKRLSQRHSDSYFF